MNAFGYWPRFHDAHVVNMSRDDSGGGALTFTVRAFETTNETDARGYFILTRHHDVYFRVEDLADVTIAKHADILDCLVIDDDPDDDGRYLVVLESVMGTEEEGYGSSFRARSGAVTDIVLTKARP